MGQKKKTKRVERLEERQERRRPAGDPKFQSRNPAANLGEDWRALNDPTNNYANAFDNFIHFQSTISGKAIKFKAMLTQFEDQFSSEWNSEQVYGRNDPIQTFRNTTRKIIIAWDAPAASYYEAVDNMINAAELVRMLYPSYETGWTVSTINKAPIIKVSFRNLIQGWDGSWLFVTLDGITFSPDLEAGWFDVNEDEIAATGVQPFNTPVNELVPKLLKFSCTMTVLHQKTIGHVDTKWPEGDWGAPKHPNLRLFPNLPRVPGESRENLETQATKVRQGADLEAEEADEFDRALAAANDVEKSNSQKRREARQKARQKTRAQRLDGKIKEAKEAAGMYDLSIADATALTGPIV